MDRLKLTSASEISLTSNSVAGSVTLPDRVHEDEDCRTQHGQVLGHQLVRLERVPKHSQPAIQTHHFTSRAFHQV